VPDSWYSEMVRRSSITACRGQGARDAADILLLHSSGPLIPQPLRLDRPRAGAVIAADAVATSIQGEHVQ
jgi:hypothetical protein